MLRFYTPTLLESSACHSTRSAAVELPAPILGGGLSLDEKYLYWYDTNKNGMQEVWDGEWYRRSYFDHGEPLGSGASPEIPHASFLWRPCTTVGCCGQKPWW
jgi:hypothetical protein